MLADQVAYVVGVDTHRDEHVLAVVASPSGAVVARRSVRSTARGYAEALRFAAQHAPAVRVWAVEGAGSYGAGLTRFLSGRGESVLEAGRGPRDERRLRGKDDPRACAFFCVSVGGQVLSGMRSPKWMRRTAIACVQL